MEALSFLNILHKQKVFNNRLTRNTQLSILHFLIAVYTNYCSHFEEMRKVQFFYLKCYNQSCIMHYAIYSNSYSTDKVLFTNKKDSRMWKKYPHPLAKLQSLTFQQNGVMMVWRHGMRGMFIQHFLAFFEFTVPFQPILSFLSLTLSILDKDSNWAGSSIFSKKTKKKNASIGKWK